MYGLGVCYFYDSDLTLQDTDNAKMPCAGESLVDNSNSITGEYGLCAAGMGLDAAVRKSDCFSLAKECL